MENVFEVVVSKMVEIGMYNLVIFVLALTIFYAILKRSKVLGESPLINGVISFAVAFLVFGYPVIIGYSLVTPFVSMFTQTTVFIMVFLIAFLIASLFYPDMPKFLTESFKSRGMLMNAIAIGVGIAILSGAVSILWNVPKGNEGLPAAPTEISIMAGAVIVLILILLVASSVVSSKS
jgi:uncharacterized membrane protein YjfL (UPF0719 family)